VTARNGPAALATIAILATALGLASCGSSSGHQAAPSTASPPTSSPPTSGPSSTTTAPAGTTQSAPGPYDWTRAASPALAIGGGASSSLAAIVAPAGGSPWIVAGTRLGADGSSTATVWSSATGASWRATALTGPQVDSQTGAATSWRQGTVVVGSVGRGADSQAAVWMASAPGAAFVQVPIAGPSTPGSAMSSVSGGALGLFAAGSANGHVALWYSSNGQRWTELTAAERVIGNADGPHIQILLAGREGNVYAAGWERSGSSIVAAMWSSSDGINWYSIQSARPAFAGPGDHVITGLAAFGTGLVAVGGTRTSIGWVPTSWISPNGASWSQPSVNFGLSARPQADAALGMARGLFAVATGEHSAVLAAVGGGLTAQRLWTSVDGLHWSELSFPPAAADTAGWQASLVAVAGPTLMVADADPGQPHLLVRRTTGWLEPSSNPAVFGPVQTVARPAGLTASATGILLAVEVTRPTQALGSSSSSVEFLNSIDGTTWTPIATGDTFAGGRIEGLGTVPGGFVAVGWTQIGTLRRASAWISADGRSWSPSAPLDLLPLAASDQASGVCVDGSLIAVVGQVEGATGTAARAWVSRDGRQWTVVTIGPRAIPGTSTSMMGCNANPSPVSGSERVDAFGFISAHGSTPSSAFWSAEHATVWTQDTTSPFGPGFPFPAVDLARAGTQGLAATAQTAGAGLMAGPLAAGADTSGLWRTANTGAGWQRLDTPGSPWLGAGAPRFEDVGWFGPTPVVAGVVDGRLAVWTGASNG
jgi:hypothetical protein